MDLIMLFFGKGNFIPKSHKFYLQSQEAASFYVLFSLKTQAGARCCLKLLCLKGKEK